MSVSPTGNPWGQGTYLIKVLLTVPETGPDAESVLSVSAALMDPSFSSWLMP